MGNIFSQKRHRTLSKKAKRNKRNSEKRIYEERFGSYSSKNVSRR